MTTIDARHAGQSRSAKAELIDLHFEVRNAIAEVLNSPTSSARVGLRRALHRFLAAQRRLAGMGEAVAGQLDLAERREQILQSLQRLDAARDRDTFFRTAESLRGSFLEMCHPLWHWREPPGEVAEN